MKILHMLFSDRDGDKILTEEEFAALPPGEVEGPEEYKKLDEVWQKERRKEFQEVIDKNKDGKVTKEELKVSQYKGLAPLKFLKGTVTWFIGSRIHRSKWKRPDEQINVIPQLHFVLCRRVVSRYTYLQ